MILVWGLPEDAPTAAVYAALGTCGASAFLLNQRAILDITAEFVVGGNFKGRLRVRSQSIDLEAVNGLYFRPYDSRELPDVKRAGPGAAAWTTALRIEEAITSWADLTDAIVVNRPTAMASNASKPHQAMTIRSVGFKTPETLITTDPAPVYEFLDDHSTVVYKSISAVRSIVSRLTKDRMARIEEVRWCPTQFQEYVPGTDYRAHVVGDDLFVCRIDSDGDDYRYAAQRGGSTKIQEDVLPGYVAERCVALSKAMGLLVSGIDLRLSEDGEWYCFEVNPSPGFTYYQEATGQRIDQAIAQVLTGGRQTTGGTGLGSVA